MKAEYVSELDMRFHSRPNKGRRHQLIAPFTFIVDDERFDIPIAFWSDFASVPRFIWPIISPYDLGKGCWPHDWGYYLGSKTKQFWDSVFWACMRHDQIALWRRIAAFQAVNLFGNRTWKRYRSQGTTAEQLARLDERPCCDR
jgi:hypothetical protein